jgi:hypothetical protein
MNNTGNDRIFISIFNSGFISFGINDELLTSSTGAQKVIVVLDTAF